MKPYSRFTPELAQQVIDAVASGQTMRAAAAVAGISHVTVYEWLARGRKQRIRKFAEFATRMEEAKAKSERLLVQVLRRTVMGGVYRLPIYNEDGGLVIDQRSGQPKTQKVVLLPDGNLALRLLAVRNPREWGGGADKTPPPPNLGRRQFKPGEIINLYFDAFQIMIDHGIRPPAELAAKLLAWPQP